MPLAAFNTTPKNILIGHSLTYTDNHLDIFIQLKKIKIDKKLLVDTFLIGSSTQGILSTYKIDEVVKKETITISLLEMSST